MKQRSDDPSRICMALDLWPEADRAAWARALRPGDPFSDPGHGAVWATATRKRYERAYGRWLSFLQMQGWLDEGIAPADRITVERIDGFVDLLKRQVASMSVWSYIEGLRNVARSFEPAADLACLSAVVSRLASERKPVRPNFADQISIRDVFHAAVRRMEELRDVDGGDPIEHAVAYRDALMVAIQASVLLRPKNFAALRLGTHITRQSDAYFLVIPAAEVKNRRIIEEPIPAELTLHLDTYFEEHRPQLLQNRSSDHLWISYQGKPLHPDMVGRRVKVTAQRLTGITLTIHQFRHCAITSVATDLPERVRMGAAMLNHTTHSTSERYYNRAGQMEASRRNARAIADRIAALRTLALANDRDR